MLRRLSESQSSFAEHHRNSTLTGKRMIFDRSKRYPVTVWRWPFSESKTAYENLKVSDFDFHAGVAWSKSVTVRIWSVL